MKTSIILAVWTLALAGFLNHDAQAQTAVRRQPLAEIDKRAAKPGVAPKLPGTMQTAAVALRARAPGANVDWHAVTGAPRLIQSPNGFLTGPKGEGGAVTAATAKTVAADDSLRAVKTFLTEHQALFGHGPKALETATKHRDYTDAHNGLRTVVWRQETDGIPVFEGLLKAHLTARGELVSIGSSWIRNPDAAATAGTPARAALVAAPRIDAAEALARAGAGAGSAVDKRQVAPLGDAEGAIRRQAFTAPTLSDASAELTWLPMDAATMRLCWQTVFTSNERAEMFMALVDVETGEVLLRRGLTEYVSDASYNVFTSDSPTPFSPGYATPAGTQPALVGRTLVTTKALDLNASPNGWIDDGILETRGNNVDAHTDTNADNVADLPRPQAANRVFDFPLDLTLAPASNKNAAVTSLFYWVNFAHDRFYQLGFTEAAGNFQNNNFGRGGLGNDAVQADAQDGSGTNNANFSSPPDGSAGRVQMYVFTGPTPDRDGDFDAEVMLHECTHGLSNRLVGGGVGISALQTRGMGEGWSDFYAMSLLSEAGDNVDGNFASGGYASNQIITGFLDNYYYGIRRYPYSTQLTKNPLTFKDIDPVQASLHTGILRSPAVGTQADEVHNMGEVWCATLWQARANLVRKLGFPTGNDLMLQLVTDGMKLAPANPNFVEARNAILQAELVLTGGANRGELWTAFAQRGLGSAATSPSSALTGGLVESYLVPEELTVTPATGATLTGPIGGPFPGTTYTLRNTGPTQLGWRAAANQPWLDVTPASGTLAPGASVTVTAVPNFFAATLTRGTYTAALTFTNVNTGFTQPRAVSLVVQPIIQALFTEDFESGRLAPARWTASGTGPWRTQVVQENGPHAGSHHLTMDTSTDNVYARNEATLTLDLAGRSGLGLTFWAKGFGDEPDGPPAYPFTTGANFDGVAISADGTTWYEVQGLRSLSNSWQQYTVDLDAAIAAAGISYNAAFKIRFNQYDNFTIPSDGIAIDDIVVGQTVDTHLAITFPAVLNEGSGPAIGTVSATPAPAADLVVTLASSVPEQLHVQPTVAIRAGQTTANFSVVPIDDTRLNGTRTLTVTATAPSWLGAARTLLLEDNETAVLSVSLPSPVTEDVGVVTGTVTVSAAPDEDVVVTLAGNNPLEATVPATVTIPAGQMSATFPITVVDDLRIDGTVATTITASVSQWVSGSADLTVLDNELKVLGVSGPATMREGDAPGVGTVQISGTLATPLTVTLASNLTGRLTVPASVTIAAGKTSATFAITVLDNAVRDGAQAVQVTAGASGFTGASATVTVQDNDVHHFAFGPLAGSQVRGQPFAVTVFAKDVNDVTITNYNTSATLTGNLGVSPVTLTGWVNGAATVNATATVFGPNGVLTASDGLGHLGTSSVFAVGLGSVAKYTWSTIPSPQTQDTYFNATVSAQDGGGNAITNFNGTAKLDAVLSSASQADIGTGVTDWSFPMYTYYHDSRTQVIYLKSEVGGARRITGLALYVDTLPGQTMNAWTIRMKHTTLASYGTAGWDGTGWTVCYQANETVTQTGWVNFQFTTPFDYDGTSNLMVDFSHNNTSFTSAGAVRSSLSTTGSRALYYYTDSGYGDPLTWSGTTQPSLTSTNVPNLRLTALTPGGGGSLPVDPPVTGNFVNGVWSGQISVPFTGANLTLRATDVSGASSVSNAFTVQAATAPGGSGSGTVFSENFEGTLGAAWTLTGTNTWRTVITTANGPHGGTHHLMMDSSVDGTYARNEATLTVNLLGRTGAVLSFWANGYSDEPDGPPTIPFTTGADFDGVAISANGTTWYEVQALRTLSGIYTQYTVNLDAAIAQYGLAYSSTFKIRFNHYDNYTAPTDGIAIDDVLITATALPTLVVAVPAQVTEGAGVLPGSVTLPATAGSPTTVTLVSSAPAKVTVPASIVIAAGQLSAPFNLTVLDNAINDGPRDVVITATTASGRGLGTVHVLDNEAPTVALALPATVTEGQAGVTGTLTLTALPVAPLTFTLTSNNPAAATVPATVAFKAGDLSATFAVTVPNDDIANGTRTTTITAVEPGGATATANLAVLDDETATIALSLPANVNEGDLAVAGTVTAGFAPATPMTITLDSSDRNKITVPATVTIPAGARSVAFIATLIDDANTDGTRNVTITAATDGLGAASAVVAVADNDVHHFALSPVAGSQIRGLPFSFTVEAKDVNGVTMPDFHATTSIAAANGAGAVSLSTDTLTGWVAGVWTGALAVNENAAGVTLTVGGGTPLAATSNAFDVSLGALHHFAVSVIGASQTQNAPFSVAIAAQDEGNNPLTNFTGAAGLSATTTGPVQILSWIGFADVSAAGDYENTKQVIAAHFQSYNETSTTVTDASELAAALVGRNVFLVPAQKLAPAGRMETLGKAWGAVLRNFTAAGGTVIVCSYQKDEHLLLSGSGLLTATKGAASALAALAKTGATVLNAGVASSFSAVNICEYTAGNGAVSLRAAASSNAVVLARDFGSGHAVLLGTDFSAPGTDLDLVLAHAVALGAPSLDGAPVLPLVTGAFVNGVWSGNVVVPFTGTALRLRADDGAGHVGESNLFTVGAPSSPTIDAFADQTIDEDGATAELAFTVGDAQTDAAALTVQAMSSNTALVAVEGIVFGGSDASRTVKITPLPDAHGTAQITLTVTDGDGESTTTQFLLTVNSVNDAPSFTKGSDQSVRQNAGPQTVAGWAGSIKTGPDEEAGQTVRFLVTNDHAALFATPPAIAADGTLTFTPAANASGSATVTVVLQDDGGTANGGVDQSAAQTFTIASSFVNDAPSFVAGASLQTPHDAGPQSLAGWATHISAGPEDEAAQALQFIVGVDNPALFAAQPAVAGDGTLTFAPMRNASGIAHLTVQLKDDGGTDDGGSNLSAPQAFTIAVTRYAEESGFYHGLLQAPAGVAVSAERSGVIYLLLARHGAFTGRIVLDHAGISFAGHLDEAGVAHFGSAGAVSLAWKRPGLPTLFVGFKVDVVDGTDTLVGSLHDDTSTHTVFHADRALYTAARKPVAPLRNVPPEMLGLYTVVFGARTPAEQQLPAAQFPQGDGSGIARVTASGYVRVVATLADGTPMSYGNFLSKLSELPLYFSPRKGCAITGPLTFRDQPGSDVDGEGLLWFRPAGPGAFYPAGWPAGIRTDLVGSHYQQLRGAPVFSGFTAANVGGNTMLSLTDGGLGATGLDQMLHMDNNSGVRAVLPATATVALRVVPATGLFTGSFVDPATGVRGQIKGAVLKKRNIGTGAFRAKNEIGGVSLAPH
jgi:hypothetical protein